MSSALTLSFDDDVLSRLDAAAASRQVSSEQLVRDILAAFLDEEEDAEVDEWQLAKVRAGQAAASQGEFASNAEVRQLLAPFEDLDAGGERTAVTGLLPWQEERVERGRADIARGAVASEADLDRVRRKYD